MSCHPSKHPYSLSFLSCQESAMGPPATREHRDPGLPLTGTLQVPGRAGLSEYLQLLPLRCYLFSDPFSGHCQNPHPRITLSVSGTQGAKPRDQPLSHHQAADSPQLCPTLPRRVSLGTNNSVIDTASKTEVKDTHIRQLSNPPTLASS